MREVYIKIEGYHLLDVKECTIYQCVNEHGVARISGHIADEDENECFQKSLADESAKILGVDETGCEFTLFQGIISQCTIKCADRTKMLEMELKSTSYLLDINAHTRSFQDDNITYYEVIDKVMDNYEKAMGRIETNEEATIEKYLVQYKETDWQFLKRVASRMGTQIIPNAMEMGIQLQFGLMENSSASDITVEEYKIGSEKGQVYYIVKSRDYFPLGTKIEFKGTTFYIFQVDSKLEGAELYHSYVLKRQSGFECEEYENDKIAGVSLEGYIADVKEDKVQIELEQDVLSSTKKWFPYATIYSSPDGTGWYCMPENGDRVRVYFPDSSEKNAYVMSSVHVGNMNNGARSNPDEKSIKSKYGKEILFKPDSLLITNNNGMSIELNDNEGISIISDKKIEMTAQEGFQIASINDSVKMIAKDQLLLKQNESYISIEDDIIIDGGQVKMV